MKKLLLLCWVILVLVSPGAHAQRGKHDYDSNFETVRAMLEQPESQMAHIKLTIDRLIDPMTDKAAVLKQLDEMAADIKASFPLGASNLVKFKALRDYLYGPPILSGRKPFIYNFEDDRNPKAKLLSVYLATRKGNCVSMPLLFVILGQKLGIPVTITTAPAHLYVKFRGDNGNWYGVEATNGGGWAEDDWQQTRMGTSEASKPTKRALQSDFRQSIRPCSHRGDGGWCVQLRQYDTGGIVFVGLSDARSAAKGHGDPHHRNHPRAGEADPGLPAQQTG